MRSGHIGKALLLVFSVVLLAVLASDASDAESGTCGDGVSWVFDAGTLTISGTGGMTNYDGNGQPWYNHADEIDNIVIEEGIRHIGKRAFVGTHITELFLPDSVRSIGEAAFESCAFLQSVRMGSELASFSSSIFKDSPKLYHIEVSDDNPYIFAHTDIVYMKRNCRPCLIPLGLKFTEIPAGTPSGAFETGEKGSFFGCMDLTRIDVESGNQYYSSYDGVLFTSGYYQMVCVPRAKTGTFTIPDQTIDAQFSFIGSSLSRVILGAGIKDVKEAHLDFASANCINNSLLCLVIGEHVRNLENSSSLNGNFTLLRWCTAIQTVTANGNPVYGAIDGMLYSKESSTLLYVSVASEGVVVPGNIVKIGRYAFRDCIHLEEVVFPDSLKSLEINAFSNCPLLHRIVYGSGLNCTLRYDMFVDCNQLTEFHTDNNTKYYTMEDGAVYRTEGGGKVLSYVPNGLLAFLVTDDVVSIDEYAFRNNVKIQSVNVGAEITKISNYQFYECTSLTSVTLPASLKSIGSYAFYRAGIIEITFPASIEDIGNDAFSRCAYLKSVTFLSNETTLGSRAFYMCSELTTLVLPSNLKNIMVESFYGCSSLGSVSIPDSVKVISRGAFSNCSSIDGICIPSALETLGESAFSGCYSACFLQFSGTNLTSIPDRAFSGTLWRQRHAAVDGQYRARDAVVSDQEQNRFDEIVDRDRAAERHAFQGLFHLRIFQTARRQHRSRRDRVEAQIFRGEAPGVLPCRVGKSAPRLQILFFLARGGTQHRLIEQIDDRAAGNFLRGETAHQLRRRPVIDRIVELFLPGGQPITRRVVDEDVDRRVQLLPQRRRPRFARSEIGARHTVPSARKFRNQLFRLDPARPAMDGNARSRFGQRAHQRCADAHRSARHHRMLAVQIHFFSAAI